MLVFRIGDYFGVLVPACSTGPAFAFVVVCFTGCCVLWCFGCCVDYRDGLSAEWLGVDTGSGMPYNSIRAVCDSV